MIGFNQVLIVLNLRAIKDGEGLCINWKSEVKWFIHLSLREKRLELIARNYRTAGSQYCFHSKLTLMAWLDFWDVKVIAIGFFG